jgi:hypothetical protein
VKDLSRAPLARGITVSDDWCAWLPEEKDQLFHSYAKELETCYAMFSVALNEALELRVCGRLGKAYQALCVTPDLCKRLVRALESLLWALGEHAKHYGTVPNAAPLEPGNFQGNRGQRSARMSGLLSCVILSQRSQFLHKVSTLAEMVEDLSGDFCSAAGELTAGMAAIPSTEWQAVDSAHFDLNTCLRESIVLLKSFLCVLPEDQLSAFQQTVRTQMRVSKATASASYSALRHRRIAPVAGE